MTRSLRLFQYAVPLFLLALVVVLERLATPPVYVWALRAGTVAMIALLWWGIAQKRKRTLNVPLPSHYPVEPLQMLTLLKSLEPSSPHCLWSGALGQLWGMCLQGYQPQIPFAQDGNETWVWHLAGDKLLIDAGTKAEALVEGDFLKLPKGMGKGGLRCEGRRSYLLWVVPPTR